ncbi:MAG: polyprenyl synthetase family protein [Muribaculaceae bacterium]|nr:polyprenyl synthetase family protein [Muribaculaceae bacterium]
MPEHSAATLDSITAAIAPQLTQLNQRIMLSLQSSNEMMNGIIQEYLRQKGKQIRPITVILCAQLFNAQTSHHVISTAAAVEMLHNASLIHDDVVDESKMRRNEPTVNGIWDNHIAVLVGDFFTSTSLQLANETGDIRIIGALASLGRQLAMGELDQIYNARYHRLSIDAYMKTIERKTASLFIACAEMGAFAAGCATDDPRLTALREFARLLGLCFQITDDIFDYSTSADAIGKPTGNDLREGKVTLPLLTVLLDPSVEGRDEMLALVSRDSLTADEIRRLIDFALANDGISRARQTIETLAQKAAETLTAAFPPGAAREHLLALLRHILSRTK